MLKRSLFLLIFAGLAASLTAQEKKITLEEIWNLHTRTITSLAFHE